MNKVIVFTVIVLVSGCSSDAQFEWGSDDDIDRERPVFRIHGDERSPNQRYLDCIRKAKSQSQRRHCATRYHAPDDEYIGVELPLRF